MVVVVRGDGGRGELCIRGGEKGSSACLIDESTATGTIASWCDAIFDFCYDDAVTVRRTILILNERNV